MLITRGHNFLLSSIKSSLSKVFLVFNSESKRNSRSAFTLIELMVVVVIVGILAAIAIPVYSSATRKAKLSEAKIILKQIRQCNELFYMNNGYYFGPAYDIGTTGCPEIGFDKPSGNPRFIYSIFINSPPTYVAFPKAVEDGGDAGIQGYEIQIDVNGYMKVIEPGDSDDRKAWGKGGIPGNPGQGGTNPGQGGG